LRADSGGVPVVSSFDAGAFFLVEAMSVATSLGMFGVPQDAGSVAS